MALSGFLYLILYGSSIIYAQKTDDVILQTLKTYKIDANAAFELLNIDLRQHVEKSVRSKRSAEDTKTKISLTAFNDDIDLYLEPNDHVLYGSDTPIYLVSEFWNRLTYKRGYFSQFREMKSYIDQEKRAAITIFEDKDGEPKMTGIIGTNLQIHPLLNTTSHDSAHAKTHLVIKSNNTEKNLDMQFQNYFDDKAFKKFTSADSSPNSLNDGPIKNFIVENGNIEGDIVQHDEIFNNIDEEIINYDMPAPPGVKENITNNFDTAYLQVLVTVDYESTRAFNNIEEFVIYHAAFWNAVDLRYRELDDPKVRLNIAGLIIPAHPRAAWYLNPSYYGNNIFYPMGSQFQKFTNVFPLESYDVIVGFIHENKLPLTGNAIGYATLDQACGNRYGQAVLFLADKSAFDGVTIAAHELAHSLGVRHDGEAMDSSCWNVKPGYMMYPSRSDSRDGSSIHWSSCSKTQMSRFLRSQQAFCLYNKPEVGTPYPKILPGKLQSRDEQCKRIFGPDWTESEGHLEYDCLHLWCSQRTSAGYYGSYKINYQTKFSYPAEGTPCGTNKACLNGQCVSEEVFAKYI